MNGEVKQMWVDALRSGEYQQGFGQLRVAGGYCCLGVLCDLHRRRTNQGEWLGDGYISVGASIPELGTLPKAVKDWAGLSEDNPNLTPLQMSLSELNDAEEMSFSDIANLIDEHLEAE